MVYSHPTVLVHQGMFYRLDKVDSAGVDGNEPWARRLLCSASGQHYNLTINLYEKEPREWPPFHIGERGLGINLDEEQARALRDSLNAWLKEE